MAELDLRITELGPVLFPARVDEFAGLVRSYFESASGGEISLTVSRKKVLEAEVESSGVGAFELHEALHEITGNKANQGAGAESTDQLIKNIGLIFAGSYAPFPPNALQPEGILGVLFDRGFKPDGSLFNDNSNQEFFAEVPREGCAVFLDEIERVRGGKVDDPELSAEVFYTMLHELGHVFNLGHIDAPDQLMGETSPGAKAHPIKDFGKGIYDFTEEQRAHLKLCSKRIEVHPGGTDYGILGGLAVPPGSSFLKAQSRADEPLKLHIDLQPREFYAVEPVELDLRLSCSRSHQYSVVPDALDPGYENFVIWVEDSLGERRRYRSPKHFCTPGKSRRIVPGEPFRRDISIFGESGGYVFQRAGVHRIWVEFAINRQRKLRSNVIECEVLPYLRASEAERRRLDLLRRAGKELYYRKGRPDARGVTALSEVTASFKDSWTSSAAVYAMGRLYLDYAYRASKNWHSRLLKKAGEMLLRAADCDDLSGQRRRTADRLREDHCDCG